MWTRRQLLGAAAAGLALPGRAATTVGPPRLVVIKVDGGWDPTHAIEPKVEAAGVDGPTLTAEEAAYEEVRTFAGIPIATNRRTRPAVGRFFDAWADRCAVVQGLFLGGIAHRANRTRLLTGTNDPESMDLVARVGATHGAHTPLGAVDLSGYGYTGGGNHLARVGATGQLRGLVDPAERVASAAGVTLSRDPAAHAALAEYQHARAAALDVDLTDLRDAIDRAAVLRERGAELGGLITIDDPSPPLEDALTLVLDLLDGGYCAAGLVSSSELAWDTHKDNALQHTFHEVLFQTLDRTVQRLVDTGRLDDTLVAVVTEIGRAPRVNAAAGKDHWPVATALLLGGPVAGGRVLGGTDDALDALAIDLETGELDPAGEILRYDHLVAGLLEAVDVDPAEQVPGVAPLRGFRV